MAEAGRTTGPREWTSNVLCRYYVHGVCRQGASCNYSHDLGSKPNNVCKFYLQGNCSYGDRCRYDHKRPQSQKPQPQRMMNAMATASPTPFPSSPAGPTTVSLPKARPVNTVPTNMVRLTKPGTAKPAAPKPSLAAPKPPEQWVAAAEFVPGRKWQVAGPSSYLAAAQTGTTPTPSLPQTPSSLPQTPSSSTDDHQFEICPFASFGECRFGENCTYMHGDVCDLCGKNALHPKDKEQREKHIKACEKSLEEDMELSFAVQRSREKCCGVCMETVWEKNPTHERRFGILSNCTHVFCLSCIRKWRSAKQFENKIVRSCPECRVKSDFITPSKYWIEDKDEKIKLIAGYKKALSTKKCKYFDEGRGECPFNENCFYKHAYPDGRRASPKPVRRRRRQNAHGDLDLITQLILWDFLEERNSRYIDLEFPESYMEDYIFQLNFAESSDDDSEYSDFFDLYPY